MSDMEKLQEIINAIPGGVAIYRIEKNLELIWFSEGVSELLGYTAREYRELSAENAGRFIYEEDVPLVKEKLQKLVRENEPADFEFRKQHRDGHLVWVRAQIKQMEGGSGAFLLHCVFQDISMLKETQLELAHLINTIPGGIASYRIEGERFIPLYFSDGVMSLSGHTREEFEELIREDALDIIYEADKERVITAAIQAVKSGQVLDVSYRMRHKDGNLIWVHLNGRRMGPLSESTRFYAVFTGMSQQTRLFQNIANESPDGIYVIGKDNYDLLYVNESNALFCKGKDCLGQKCYAVMMGKTEPCSFCSLGNHEPDGKEHEMLMPGHNRIYATRFKETDWNGVPAYIKYVRDVTEEIQVRKEKEQLEQYFGTIIQNMPNGVTVSRCDADGSMEMEFISEGFTELTHMTAEEVRELCRKDAFAGIHSESVIDIHEKIRKCRESGEERCEFTGQIGLRDGGHVWVKATVSIISMQDGSCRLYTTYADITRTVAEKEQLRRKYDDMILQHYRLQGPDTLIVGHGNVTTDRMIQVIDYTGTGFFSTFDAERENFFKKLAALIEDEDERCRFMDTYFQRPILKAFAEQRLEHSMQCYIRFPSEPRGMYVRFKTTLLEAPDTADVTAILTVSDITEQIIMERTLHELSVAGYDFVIDVDVLKDRYRMITCDSRCTHCVPEWEGCYSARLDYMLSQQIVPRDRAQYERGMRVESMICRLEEEGSYTFAFSILEESGDMRTITMTVSAIDLRLGRVCLSRTDITESIREQQGLLNVMAYMFDLAGFVDIENGSVTIYTREAVLKSLPPFIVENYSNSLEKMIACYESDGDDEKLKSQFCLSTLLERLEKEPAGYDFVLPYRWDGQLRYKKTSVLWGDQNHKTICMVRADVTDMLAAERESKQTLEEALKLAKEANRAKSDFLSSMSHDIRTPMNAIMGMTSLAFANLDDKERVTDCLNKISISSRHLQSLINDVLDMSKIERSNITLSRMEISLSDLVEQLCAMVTSQAAEANLDFQVGISEVTHPCFYGDRLRINQILINILSNAVKFTSAGGSVKFLVEEIPALENGLVRYRFTVSDTGIGIPEEFMPELFQPFARSSVSHEIDGTGLGLSITKGLVDIMGGTIEVERRTECGTVFRVELEFEKMNGRPGTDIKTMSAIKNQDNLFAGLNFLVAEDNPINAEILCEILHMQGARTVVKTNGALAVEEFQSATPFFFDAVLMDIRMPEMDGYEATRKIRSLDREDAQRIPIIAMTANAFTEDVQLAVDAGMDAHVAKPIDIGILQRTLLELTGTS